MNREQEITTDKTYTESSAKKSRAFTFFQALFFCFRFFFLITFVIFQLSSRELLGDSIVLNLLGGEECKGVKAGFLLITL